jgi:hypothetical protein
VGDPCDVRRPEEPEAIAAEAVEVVLFVPALPRDHRIETACRATTEGSCG